MKKLMIVFLIIMPLTTLAKPKFHIHAGVTRTTLRQGGGESQWGRTFGCGLEFSLPWNTFLGFDGLYLTRNAKLTNKTWPTSRELPYSDVSIGDINLRRGFLEFLPKIGYRNKVYNDKLNYKIFGGYAFTIRLNDASFIERETIVLAHEDRGNYDFDYSLQSSDIPTFTKNIFTGFHIHYGKVGVELRYHWGKTYTPIHNEISVSDNIDTFIMLFRYLF